MRKLVALLLALVMCLPLCACGSDGTSNNSENNSNNESAQQPEESVSENSKEPEIEYKSYTVNGLTFELPAELTAKQDAKELTVNFNQVSMLSVSSLYDGISSEGEFEYFCETFYVDTMENSNVANIQYEKATFGQYPAYKYTGQTLIAGSKTAFHSVVLLLGSEVVSVMMIHSGDDYNYTEIYTHLLNTIQ